MITFGLLASAMVLSAVALVVWPLYFGRRSAGPARETINVALYRDRLAELEAEREGGALSAEQLEQARVELQRDLLENVMPEAPAVTLRSRRSAFVVALLVPLLATGTYLWLGAPDFIEVETAQHQNGSGSAEMDEAVARLRARLAANPEDMEGWVLLGRSLMVQQQFTAAADTYAQALRHIGEQPELLALYAEALATAQGRVTGEPEALAMRALELNPDTVIALWLSGFAATERGDFATAVKRWERLLPLLPAESRMTEVVQESLNEARQRLGTVAPAPQASAAATSLHITVTLDDKLRSQLGPNDVLFVYVKDPSGGRMPIASVRTVTTIFPAEVVLDDSAVLVPGRRLADLSTLDIVARISHSGEAMTRSGDLYGESQVAAGDAAAVLRINQVVP